jgi:hypothetical protein
MSIIANIEELKGFLREHPHRDTGVLCTNCFEPVAQITFPQEDVMLSCGCYARWFDPENKTYRDVTTQRWSDYLETSRKKHPVEHGLITALGNGALFQAIINPSPYPNFDIWCPGCNRHGKISGRSIWVNAQGELVCVYGLCGLCAERLSDKTAQTYEERLLERFPVLKTQLSDTHD